MPVPEKSSEKFDGVTYIHDDQERRPALGCGERLGILLRLIAGAEHCLVPARRSAHCRAAAVRHLEKQGRLGSFAALLGLQDETATFVQVDEPRTREPRRAPEDDRALEDVVIEAAVLHRRLRTWNVQVIAQFRKKERVVSPFCCAGVPPPFDEFVSRHGISNDFSQMKV